MQVCKTFFLTTLGYSKNNDTVLHDVIQNSSPSSISVVKKDMRGRNPCKNKFDRSIITSHIESYHPTISHYRREHAPNVRYLSSDISVTDMHKDFIGKHMNVSYEVYRSVLKSMKISFSKLGHEECESCEKYNLHKTSHSQDDAVRKNCENCNAWDEHKKMYTAARENYKKDVELSKTDTNTLFYSVDLQKVIMLPRIDGFKSVLFTRRIVVFNESFAPLGKVQNSFPFAALWHEAIAGRNKEQIISAFHQFLLQMRDVKNIVLWVDNCSAQNKNWAFLTFLVYIINSSDVSLQTLNIKYFEPGHTFMSAVFTPSGGTCN